MSVFVQFSERVELFSCIHAHISNFTVFVEVKSVSLLGAQATEGSFSHSRLTRILSKHNFAREAVAKHLAYGVLLVLRHVRRTWLIMDGGSRVLILRVSRRVSWRVGRRVSWRMSWRVSWGMSWRVSRRVSWGMSRRMGWRVGILILMLGRMLSILVIILGRRETILVLVLRRMLRILVIVLYRRRLDITIVALMLRRVLRRSQRRVLWRIWCRMTVIVVVLI